ncbi:MAG: hypothetical protein Q7N50_04760 [Armatimonadota bacterium]|nr:hypothetical protein [Armatimonadota bacterium]
MTTANINYGTYTPMTVTNVQSLAFDATDPFTAWQSNLVDNQTSVKADDYEIFLDFSTQNTAPGSDKAAYCYVVPWTYNSSAWVQGANFGTTTLPTGSEGAASISDPNGMFGPVALPYKVAQQRLNKAFLLTTLGGGMMPDGFSLAVRNMSGAHFGTGCVVAYRPITYTWS